MPLAIAITTTLTLLLEVMERAWERNLQQKAPRITPPGYMRDAEKIRVENEARQRYEIIRPRHEKISKMIRVVKYALGIVAVALTWMEAL